MAQAVLPAANKLRIKLKGFKQRQDVASIPGGGRAGTVAGARRTAVKIPGVHDALALTSSFNSAMPHQHYSAVDDAGPAQQAGTAGLQLQDLRAAGECCVSCVFVWSLLLLHTAPALC